MDTEPRNGPHTLLLCPKPVEREEAAQEYGHLQGVCVGECTTGNTKPAIGYHLAPEIPDIDGDKRRTAGRAQQHRNRFIPDDRVWAQLRHIRHGTSVPPGDGLAHPVAQELLIEDDYATPAWDGTRRARA